MAKKKKKITRRISYLVEYIFLVIVIQIIRFVPYKASIQFGRFFGRVTFQVFRIRRKVSLRNLDIAFADTKSDQEKYQIALNAYMNFGAMALEVMKMTYMKIDDLEALVDQKDIEKIEKFISENEKDTFIALTAHLDNWEYLGAIFAKRGYPLSVLAKPMHNPRADELLNKIRNRLGYEVIATRGSMREIVTRLRQKRILCFLADQDARHSGVFVDFFDTPASSFEGPAVFMNRLNLPILNVFIVREGTYRHKIVIKDVLTFPENMEKEDAIKEVTQRHTKNLEEMIREYPEQYFWFHKRWKTQPDKKKMY